MKSVFFSKTVIISIIVLVFVTTPIFASYTRAIQDSSFVRGACIESWFTGSISTVKNKAPEIRQNELGINFQIRSEPYGENQIAIIITPEKIIPVDVYSEEGVQESMASVFPAEIPGCWILFRNLESGKPVSVRYYFAADSEVYIQFNIASPKNLIDFVIFGAYAAKSVPTGLSVEQLYTASFQDILSWTSKSLPWNEITIYDGMYNASEEMISDIRRNLKRIILTDDAAYDSGGESLSILNGEPIVITDENGNNKQVESLSLNSTSNSNEVPVDLYLSGAGFIKWIVDGLVRPLAGASLKIKPLLEPTVVFDTGGLSDVYSSKYNLSFSLDWTRNLAAAAVSISSGAKYYYNNSGADVKIEPFAAMTKKNSAKKTAGYVKDVGYSSEVLKPLLYVLATTEPGRFYLGAIRDSSIQEKSGGVEVQYFNRAAAFFPYFDTDGYFCVVIFADGKEIPLGTFLSTNEGSYIHLVRINASNRFILQ